MAETSGVFERSRNFCDARVVAAEEEGGKVEPIFGIGFLIEREERVEWDGGRFSLLLLVPERVAFGLMELRVGILEVGIQRNKRKEGP